MKNFFNDYFEIISKKLYDGSEEELTSFAGLVLEAHNKGGRVLFFGNGGSASIASHAAIDLTKSAKICAMNFSDNSLITCLSNDFGYEEWVSKAINYFSNEKDLIVIISSSGRSKNMINGANQAKSLGLPLITLSGFSSDNELRTKGKINMWVNSAEYNVVETVHQTWILSVIDLLAKNN
ncbi:MAG: hypothetical protein CBC25_04420 [Pelagibacteraceae bacterium TMED65]|nr:MAG: hypothetical protein CBC25_04420 [Pelagibacteraceae bacterium TMED65]|tara:strand:+ start:426 stop:965 length:540 start_codon:yes stop_codon:yes gene_type:complete